MTLEPNTYETGKLTEPYVAHPENAIRKIPANYLWNHRRGKWNYDAEKNGVMRVAQ